MENSNLKAKPETEPSSPFNCQNNKANESIADLIIMDFLVIDDDKTFRDATCFLIEDAGHYAEGVESGALGLQWLKEDKWDAVLLDLNLGNENGLDVLTEIVKR